MEKKTLSNDQILDAIYDLADESGMKIDDFILKLQADAEASGGKSREGLPEEIISELEEARMLKKKIVILKKNRKKVKTLKKKSNALKQPFPMPCHRIFPIRFGRKLQEVFLLFMHMHYI